MPALAVENLSKHFRDSTGRNIWAVQNLNFTVDKNEILVLAGPSGCGKTTTLRLIAGLEEADGGRVLLNGALINHTPARSRDIAMVFQSHALFPHMTAFENMAFGLKLRKVPKAEIEKRINETAEMLGLSNKLHRKPGELSGGENQRVALGRAFVRRPKVFLLDEPLSHLDAPNRAQLRCEIRKLHQHAGVPAIYVTHDQTEALTMGQRIAVMKDGQIQQIGTPSEIQQHPANDFVRQFLNPVT